MSKTVYLTTPLTEEAVRSLSLDDTVYLSGELICMLYPFHFTKAIDLLKKGEKTPFPLVDGSAVYHCPAGFRKNADGTFDLRFVGSTTSSKFNAWTPEFLKLSGVRAVIGKGGMDTGVLSALKEHGGVYLAVAGGCSAIYTTGVESLEAEYWPQPSWADNVIRLRIKNFGPLTVAMDAHGHSIYEESGSAAQDNLPSIYEKLGIQSFGNPF